MTTYSGWWFLANSVDRTPHTPRRRKPSNILILNFFVGKFLTAVTSYDRRQHSGSKLGDLGLRSLIILGEGKNRLFTPLAITLLILHLLIACRWIVKFWSLYLREIYLVPHSTGGSPHSTANLDVLEKKKISCPSRDLALGPHPASSTMGTWSLSQG